MMMGGTELSNYHLHDHILVPNTIKLHVSTIHDIDPLRHNILWLHQAHDQSSVQNLPQLINQLDHLVFVSHWQREQYCRWLIPNFPLEKTTVIRNAVVVPNGISSIPKSSTETRLIYSSTPFRGLDVLLDAFDLIDDNSLFLDVYSSMLVYGPSYASLDSNYEHLYERCRQHPRIVYHGSVDQETLHRGFNRAHILAYPCTWEETSCITAMEAMIHGCLLVTSDIGALPETTAGLAITYTPNPRHAEQYADILVKNVTELRSGKHADRLKSQQSYAAHAFNWEQRANEWASFFDKYNHRKTSIWRI